MSNKTYKKHSTKVIKGGKKTYIINSFLEDDSNRNIARENKLYNTRFL